MPRRAKRLNADEFKTFLSWLSKNSPYPERDIAIARVSFGLGLRAAEIADLEWRDVMTPFGAIHGTLTVATGKGKKPRDLPVPKAVRDVLLTLLDVERRNHGRGRARDRVFISAQGQPFTPNNMQRYISRLFTRANFEGCTSHSGRRTLLTEAVRRANTHGCSVRDVQALSGHAHVSSLEPYLDPSERLSKLVDDINDAF